MRTRNRFKFTRQDKRKGKREGLSLQQEFDLLTEEFEEILFSDDCPDNIFEEFSLIWKEFAEEYNKKKDIVSIANPRAFHDYCSSHSYHVYDKLNPEAPTYLNPILVI